MFPDINSNIFAEFEQIVKTRSDDYMIITKDTRYSYQQIYNEVIWYAQKLRDVLSGKRERILLELEHTYKIVVAILAVLHEGCSYVPLRKTDMRDLKSISEATGSTVIISDCIIDDCNLKQIIVSEMNIEKSDLSEAVIKSAASYDINEEVYVLFTSGSTGIPKGCSISMNNLRYIISNMKRFNSPGTMVYGFTTPYTFDVSTSEIYSFLYGASIAIIDFSCYSEFRRFPELICELGITHLSMSPSAFFNILKSFSHERISIMSKCLKCVFIAGEAFNKSIWTVWEENKWAFRLYNLYGPTEGTVYATMYELEHGKAYSSSIPIGKCLEGAQCVIDGEGGSYGELIIGGEGVCNGYINAEEETDRNFYEKDGVRYYRTGDYVSIQDGLLYFHGRKDDQVQINGIRVELGEVVTRLKQIKYIEEAVVLYENNQLIAFVQFKNSEKAIELDRNDFTKVMPRYMCPNKVFTVKQFKLTNHGKIDKRFLSNLYQNQIITVKPEISIKACEEALVILNIMNDCIGEIRMHSTEDDFYDAGADSLATFSAAIKISDMLNYPISPDDIYYLRTPIKLSNHFSEINLFQDKTTCENSEKILNQITQLNQDILHYLYNIGPSEHEFAAIHNQYYYYYRRHNYVMIPFVFKFITTNVEEVANAICRVVSKNPILGSSIMEREGVLYFVEHTPPKETDIPVFTCDLENASDYVREYCEKEVFNARYMSGRLAVFVVIKRRSGIDIVCVLDHCIGDGACVNIIKKKLSDELNHIGGGSCLQYEDYCHLLRAHNSDISKALDCKYIRELKECKVTSRIEQISSIPDKFTLITQQKHSATNNIRTIFRLMYKVGKSFEAVLAQDEYALKTIINLREYKNYSFKDTVGDMHTNISFRYSKGISFENFCKHCEDTIEFFSENLFSSSFMKHKKMLRTDELQQQIDSILTNCKLFSINYLGEISENDIEAKLNDIRQLQDEMYRDEKLIYVTAVTCGDNLLICTNKEVPM